MKNLMVVCERAFSGPTLEEGPSLSALQYLSTPCFSPCPFGVPWRQVTPPLGSSSEEETAQRPCLVMPQGLDCLAKEPAQLCDSQSQHLVPGERGTYLTSWAAPSPLLRRWAARSSRSHSSFTE